MGEVADAEPAVVQLQDEVLALLGVLEHLQPGLLGGLAGPAGLLEEASRWSASRVCRRACSWAAGGCGPQRLEQVLGHVQLAVVGAADPDQPGPPQQLNGGLLVEL